MTRVHLSMIAGVACALALAIPSTAANAPAAKANDNAKATAVRSVWSPETLSGKISMVDPQQHLLVIQDDSGVPFDMVVTRHTRIRAGDQSLKLKDLSQDVNKNVSIRFTPERAGDMASTIKIGG